MRINEYVLIFSIAYILLFLTRRFKDRASIAMFTIAITLLMITFRSNLINDDAMSYLYYFKNVKYFSSLNEIFESTFFRVEYGFRALLYFIPPATIFNDEAYVYKFVLSLINTLIFYKIFVEWKKKDIRGFEIFVFLYFSFFIAIFELAIIRFSLASSIFILAYNYLIIRKNKKKAFGFFLIASSIHYAVAIAGIIFIYYYYVFYHVKMLKALMIITPFVLTFFILSFVEQQLSLLGSYYLMVFNEQETRLSIRIIAEASIIYLVRSQIIKINKSEKIFSLLLVLYLFFSFLEVYFGILTLNRLRILVFMIFLFSVSFSSGQINKKNRSLIYFYAFIFFIIGNVTLINTWGGY